MHIPVLAREVLAYLAVRPGGVYLDCTVGLGGHAALMAEAAQPGGRVIGLDRDPEALSQAARRLAPFGGIVLRHANYGCLRETLAALGVARVDGVLIDAGVSSFQLDSPERGFSFQADGPLDMRMDASGAEAPAAAWIASVSEGELAAILRRYGDIGPAGRIARTVVRRRDAGQLKRTGDLAQAVREALPFVKNLPEETRTVFQAIRIAVNEELRWLEAGLIQGIEVLNPGGRLVAIAFHSGEDRIVKTVLREASRPQRRLTADGRVQAIIPPRLRLLSKGPVLPGPEEQRNNPRSKSAKLRAAERRADEE